MAWYTLEFISAILSATAAIFEKKSLIKLDALEFTFFVSFTGLIFSLPFGLDISLSSISTTGFIVLFLKTILNALSFYFVMKALKNLDISNSLPLMELTPGFVAVLGIFFLNEIPSFFQILGILLLIAGTYIINLKKGSKVLDPIIIFIKSKGHNYILVALILFTITSILDKVIVVKLNVSPEHFIFFYHLLSFLIFLFIILFTGNNKKNNIFKNISKDLLLLIIAVGLLSVFYRYTQILAIKQGHVALVLAIKRTSVFFACVIGGTIFKEETLFQRIFATILLIAGGMLIILL